MFIPVVHQVWAEWIINIRYLLNEPSLQKDGFFISYNALTYQAVLNKTALYESGSRILSRLI